MPRRLGIGADEDEMEMENESMLEHHHKHHHHSSERHRKGMFWKWGCILLILAAIGVAIAGLVYAMTDDAHWQFIDEERIVSRHDGADVEVKEGGNLVIHDAIVDSNEHTVYEKITLDPFFGPEGPDLLFGAANATYARLQAFYALGFRVWDRFFIPIGGIFASNGLFGEDALAVVFDTFANWFHGPIIGTGPAILVISDEGAKENIKSLDSGVALDKVSKLEPRSFDWKGATSEDAAKLPVKMRNGMKGVHGFVAQEVGSVIPSAVHSTLDYLPEGTEFPPQALMDYNAIIVELVGAVQSLWSNGVILAGRTATANGPVRDLPITPCFNTTNFPTPRDKARCICSTMQCGLGNPNAPINVKCLDVAAACGGPDQA
jgi:hypothetical protein